MLNREAKHPREWYKYRGYRRNNSILGRVGRNWMGVEPDRVIKHPPLVKKVSHRGEVHYVELW